MSEETPSIAAPEQNAIAETGSITAKTSRGTIHCITIVGQIEGHMELPAQNKTTKYEHLIPQIAAVEQAEEIDGLLVLLNTVGGDVEAGLAIAELIAGMKKPTVSLVLGGGHSIGVPLAVAARRSFIAASAAMTIHPVRINAAHVGSRVKCLYLWSSPGKFICHVQRLRKVFVSLCYNYRHRARSANRSEKFSCTARKTEKRAGAVALARRPAVR